MRACNSARSLASRESSRLAAGSGFETPDALAEHRHLHRHHVLGEAHDAKLGRAGHAFEPLTVIESENVRHAIRRDGVPRPFGERHLDQRAAIALHEHVGECAVRD